VQAQGPCSAVSSAAPAVVVADAVAGCGGVVKGHPGAGAPGQGTFPGPRSRAPAPSSRAPKAAPGPRAGRGWVPWSRALALAWRVAAFYTRVGWYNQQQPRTAALRPIGAQVGLPLTQVGLPLTQLEAAVCYGMRPRVALGPLRLQVASRSRAGFNMALVLL
jgi:hypothetical protein